MCVCLVALLQHTVCIYTVFYGGFLEAMVQQGFRIVILLNLCISTLLCCVCCSYYKQAEVRVRQQRETV